MSQETSKEYLAAAEKANQALAIANERLSDTISSREGAVATVNFWRQKLATANPDQKSFIQNELTKSNRALAATDVRLNEYKKEVEKINNDIRTLDEQAKKSAAAPDNTANLPAPGNLSTQDATAYPAPNPYPNEGASSPILVSTTDGAKSSTTADTKVNSTNASITDEPVLRPLTTAEIEMRRIADEWAEQNAQTSERLKLQESLIAKGMSPAEAYYAAKNQIPVLDSAETAIRAASPKQIINDDPQNLRSNSQQYGPSPVPISDEEYIARELENRAIRATNNAINIADFEGVDTTDAQERLANNIRTNTTAGGTEQARRSANAAAVSQSNATDLRVRISLAKEANYMYNIAENGDILYPLKHTRGVIFPYTPQITLSYNANYDSVDPTHSNYKIYNYKNSSVESISIIGDFTAQDTAEANYLLAVIHFFKTVTKMFYGKDQNPQRGTPPPLCYLTGYGAYAFDMHPIVISSFSLSYPNDVNYINAGAIPIQGQQLTEYNKPTFPKQRGILERIAGLKSSGVAPGGVSSKKPFATVTNFTGITRVPTKMTITLTALPMITRNNVSNYFSLRDYATGALLKNSRGYGGTW